MDATNNLPLVTPADYIATRGLIFPSTESLRWYERQHRAELVDLGAVLLVNGRKLINPAAFDAAVMAIGKRLAARPEASQ